ncbi:hypothetical protein [Streptomyces sp. NPDC051561]
MAPDAECEFNFGQPLGVGIPPLVESVLVVTLVAVVERAGEGHKLGRQG